MSTSRRHLWAVVCGAALAAAAWAQGLVICAACGREAKPGQTACAHCAAKLPLPAPAAAPAAPAAAPGRAADVARLAKGVVESSLRLARESEPEQPGVALSYYQNALAVSRLLPAGTLAAGVPELIVAGNARTAQALVRGQVPCRTCKGTGKYQMDLGRVMQKGGSVKAVEGVACDVCKGAGSFAGYRDIGKAKMEILQGRQEFERRQMAAGDVRVGRALVPAGLDALLDNSGRARVMTGMPVPCGSCQLTGRQKCLTCKSTGWVKCTYTGCQNGEVEEERASSSSRASKRLNDEQTKKCPKCGGSAEVQCLACKGNGNVACSKCDGSGQAKACSRCTGVGLMTCSKCKGSGELKGGPCPECKGEKVSLCTTCRGEGAVAR